MCKNVHHARINGENVAYTFITDGVELHCSLDCRYMDGTGCTMSNDEFENWNGKCAYNSNR